MVSQRHFPGAGLLSFFTSKVLFSWSSGTWLGTLSAPLPNLEQHIPRAESVFPREGGLREDARIEGEKEEGNNTGNGERIYRVKPKATEPEAPYRLPGPTPYCTEQKPGTRE